MRNARHWNHGNAQPLCGQDWFDGHGLSCSLPTVCPLRKSSGKSASLVTPYTNGSIDFNRDAWTVWRINPAVAESLFFQPVVAAHITKLACERPDLVGRSLSQWDCTELAYQVVADGLVDSISAQTIRRILDASKLKPWRHHMWLTPKHPRDSEFYRRVSDVIDWYTRPLAANEIVLCVDEKTSLQPRPRVHPTKPAQPGNHPALVEHEYARAGALQLFAAFDTRTGVVYGQCYERKRQAEFIAFLAHVEKQVGPAVELIHIVCDNLPMHSGKQVQAWLKEHPRFRFHFTPVHCSWMNQVEQWFSILQRKRFRIADFASKADLRAKLEQFICEWNQHAHPFNWSTKSVAKVMADAELKSAA